VALGGLPDWSGGDWSVLTGDAGGRLNRARCTDIPANMSLCRGIGYAQMRLPNLLDHDSVHEATQQAARCAATFTRRPKNSGRTIPVLVPGVLRLPDHVCGTRCQSIYGTVTVSDSLNGC